MVAVESTVIRVLVADDHPPVRAGIRSMLTATARIRPCVVDEAGTTEDAMDMAARERYDVVLMDFNLPGIGGDKATRMMRERDPKTCILGFSHYTDRAYVKRMVDAGACGYVAKTIEADALYSAIRTVLSGKPYYSNEVAMQWMGAAFYPQLRDPLDSLTRQEREVLRLVLAGLKDKEIAARMYLSPRTIEKHRHNGMLKLGAHTVAELVLTAVRMGISV